MSQDERIEVLEAEIKRLNKIIQFRDQRLHQFQQSFNEIERSVRSAAELQA